MDQDRGFHVKRGGVKSKIAHVGAGSRGPPMENILIGKINENKIPVFCCDLATS